MPTYDVVITYTARVNAPDKLSASAAARKRFHADMTDCYRDHARGASLASILTWMFHVSACHELNSDDYAPPEEVP